MKYINTIIPILQISESWKNYYCFHKKDYIFNTDTNKKCYLNSK